MLKSSVVSATNDFWRRVSGCNCNVRDLKRQVQVFVVLILKSGLIGLEKRVSTTAADGQSLP